MYLYVFMILLWYYWNCIVFIKKKYKKKNEKWGKRGWILRVVLLKMVVCFERLWGFLWEKKNGYIFFSNLLYFMIIKNKVVYKNLYEV